MRQTLKKNKPGLMISGKPFFRVATPDDYEFIPELGLYELTFDKRPVQGVRTDNPVQGADQYNVSQQRIKTARDRERQRQRNFVTLREFSWNGVFDWCLEYGTPQECRLALALYHAPDKEQRGIIEQELRQCRGWQRESNAHLCAGILLLTRNHMASTEKMMAVQKKGGPDEK